MIVGDSWVNGYPHAVLWRDGHIRDLGTLGGNMGEAVAVNNHDQIVGTSTTSTGELHTFLWQKGKMTDLGLPGSSYGVSINDSGQVLAVTRDGDRTDAVLWHGGTVAQISNVLALDLNNRGEVVGSRTSSTDLDQTRAFRWRARKLTDLPTLPGATFSQASRLNDSGVIVGLSNTSQPYDFHTVMWRNGRVIDLAQTGVDTTNLLVLHVSNTLWLVGARSVDGGSHQNATVLIPTR